MSIKNTPIEKLKNKSEEKLAQIAVLGTGSIGMRHLRILSVLPDLDVYAVPTRLERLDELRAEGFKVAFQLDEIPNQDGVVVATNTGRHLSDAELALHSGAYVLVEKPLAPSTLGVRSLLELASAQKRGVFVGCCLRFKKCLLAFREYLVDIGSVYAVEISCRSYLPDWRPGRDYRSGYAADPQEGGVLRDLIHEVDYALWLFGTTKSVSGRLTNSGRLGIPTEDLATLMWTSEQGVQVCIQLDYLARNPVRQMTAFGAYGQVSVDLINQMVVIKKPGEEPKTMDLKVPHDEMYTDQAKAFLRAIEGKDPGQLASGMEGLTALAICDAARRSSQNRGAEEVVSW